jgi:Tn7-like transposition protein D/TniQ
MIGFFPDPCPDELLYSACARFSDRMKFPNASRAALVLSGGTSSRAVVDFPTRINRLMSVMPPNHLYTPDILIDGHTLYPYFAPFLPADRSRLFREDMCGEGTHIHERLGITAGRLTLPEVLRFCPECIREDKEGGRELYWRRLHQVPGVEVCPIHSVFLEESNAIRQKRSSPGWFISADRAVHNVRPRQLNKSAPLDDIRLKIAKHSAWLLNWHGPYPGSELLYKRYYHLLLRDGYAYYNGQIINNKLLEAFVKFYPPQFLETLGCPIVARRESWPLLLLRSSKAAIVQPPLQHILLLTFLGRSPEDVFTKFAEFKPFGDDPWPCLNPVAAHYRQPVITTCRITDSPLKRKRGRPKGDFHCACGFSYTRTGPDHSEEDRFRFGSVLSFGPTWIETFINQWQDASLTLAQMAHNFRTTQPTLAKHAARLNLPIPRLSSRSIPSVEATDRRYSSELTRSKYQEDWISIIESNPEATRVELQSRSYYTWWWLSKNDAEWLEEHMPQPLPKRPTPKRNNWEEIDRGLSVQVKASIQRTKSMAGRPVRATLSAVIKDVGRQSWLERYLHKLPLTAQVITEDIESYEDHLIRRLEWAAGCFHNEGIIPTRIKLLRHAGEHRRIVESQKVRECIDAILKASDESLAIEQLA